MFYHFDIYGRAYREQPKNLDSCLAVRDVARHTNLWLVALALCSFAAQPYSTIPWRNRKSKRRRYIYIRSARSSEKLRCLGNRAIVAAPPTIYIYIYIDSRWNNIPYFTQSRISYICIHEDASSSRSEWFLVNKNLLPNDKCQLWWCIDGHNRRDLGLLGWMIAGEGVVYMHCVLLDLHCMY